MGDLMVALLFLHTALTPLLEKNGICCWFGCWFWSMLVLVYLVLVYAGFGLSGFGLSGFGLCWFFQPGFPPTVLPQQVWYPLVHPVISHSWFLPPNWLSVLGNDASALNERKRKKKKKENRSIAIQKHRARIRHRLTARWEAIRCYIWFMWMISDLLSLWWPCAQCRHKGTLISSQLCCKVSVKSSNFTSTLLWTKRDRSRFSKLQQKWT